MPREPNRSKNADCGLRTATRSASASTVVRVKRSRPAMSSFSPQEVSREACGSDADAERPAGVHGVAQPGAEGFGGQQGRPFFRVSGGRRPRRRGGRTGMRRARAASPL